MKVEFIPFASRHPALIGGPALNSVQAAQLVGPFAFTAVWAGNLIGAGGVLAETPWHGTAWLLAGPAVPRRAWPAITAKAREVIAAAHAAGLCGLTAYVDPDHAAACRWIRRLGFAADGFRRAWLPDGRDAILCGRVA